jgi:hypothetical protein
VVAIYYYQFDWWISYVNSQAVHLLFSSFRHLFLAIFQILGLASAWNSCFQLHFATIPVLQPADIVYPRTRNKVLDLSPGHHFLAMMAFSASWQIRFRLWERNPANRPNRFRWSEVPQKWALQEEKAAPSTFLKIGFFFRVSASCFWWLFP